MIGQIFLTLDGILLLFGAFISDWNETHIYNPRWPPHANWADGGRAALCVPARFHNAHTMTLSLMLGVMTLFFTWRPNTSPQTARDSFRIAGALGSVYWITGFASLLFPGTDGLDPEFGGPGFPQKYAFSAGIGLAVTGMLLEGAGL
ncbi:hypothetical protein F25303_14538 [Fusarium sp. NRRL 25303]|nr:hypothetical protein F25303_14538 [Fusarium sp. NRRL 25303]